jgi:hypothetical protein
MAARFGAVITFKPGTTREQAEAALRLLIEGTRFNGQPLIETTGVHEYDDRDGGPVWYMP